MLGTQHCRSYFNNSPQVHGPYPTPWSMGTQSTDHITVIPQGHSDFLWEEGCAVWSQDILQCPGPSVIHFPVCSAPAMCDIGDMARSLKTLLLLSHSRERQRQVVKTLKQSQKEAFKMWMRVPLKTATLVREMGCCEARHLMQDF